MKDLLGFGVGNAGDVGGERRGRALGLDGRPFELEADDLLAVCIQHEMDHLEGKVFVEYLSRLKQTRIKSKLLKQARETF